MLDNNAELGWASPSNLPYEKVNITPRRDSQKPPSPTPQFQFCHCFGAPKPKEVEHTACSFNYWPLAQQSKQSWHSLPR